jgi:hypothetical protein
MAENYNLIFGSNASQTYAWSDSDYQTGWETVGDTPPTAQQFDALQNRADKKVSLCTHLSQTRLSKEENFAGVQIVAAFAKSWYEAFFSQKR